MRMAAGSSLRSYECAMATSAFRRPVMALVTAQVSRLVMSCDEVATSRQMLSLPVPGLLVS